MQEGNNPACTGFDGLPGIKFDGKSSVPPRRLQVSGPCFSQQLWRLSTWLGLGNSLYCHESTT